MPDLTQTWGSWNIPGHDFRIQYRLQTMEELRGHVCALRLAKSTSNRGFLFGRRGAGTVVVQSIALLPRTCKAKDLFDGKVEVPTPPLGLEVVGLCIIRDSGALQLTNEELNFYNIQFPQPEAVVLVVRPSFEKSIRMGFFFREANGSLRSKSSYQEIVVGTAAAPPVEAARGLVCILTRTAVSSRVLPARGGFLLWTGVAAVAAAMATPVWLAQLHPRVLVPQPKATVAARSVIQPVAVHQESREAEELVQVKSELQRMDAHRRRLEELVRVLRERTEPRMSDSARVLSTAP